MKAFFLILVFSFQAFASGSAGEGEGTFAIDGHYKQNKIRYSDQYQNLFYKENVPLSIFKNWDSKDAFCGPTDYMFYYGKNFIYLDTKGGKDFYEFIKSKRGHCTQLQRQVIHGPDSIFVQIEAIIVFPQMNLNTKSKLRVITEVKKIEDGSFQLVQKAELFCDKKVIPDNRCENVYMRRNLEIEGNGRQTH